MSMYLYDKALIDKLQEITQDNRIRIIPPEQSISFLAHIDNDKDHYPAIVVSRSSTITLNETRNQVAALKGETARIDSDNTAVKMKLIPMRLGWSISVYAVDRYTCDEIIRELVFYFITYPRFSVKVPYNLGLDQNFDIMVSPDILDNSDLIEFPNTGELFRETLTVYTENAHLYASDKIYLTKAISDVFDNNTHDEM